MIWAFKVSFDVNILSCFTTFFEYWAKFYSIFSGHTGADLKIQEIFYVKQWGSSTCKHNARWLHVSRLKASTVYFFQKIGTVNRTCQLKPEKVTDTW